MKKRPSINKQSGCMLSGEPSVAGGLTNSFDVGF